MATDRCKGFKIALGRYLFPERRVEKAFIDHGSSLGMVHRSRRSFLQGAALGFTTLGTGCLSDSGTEPASTTERDTPSPTNTATPTDTDSTPGYPTVDERVTSEPPGSPPLDPSGSWPAVRFDAGNTGWNPDGTGLRDGEPYWRLRPGGAASVANEYLYNTADLGEDTVSLACRDPATASVETASDLVSYGVNSPPVVTENYVFITTFIEVFCFDAETGKQVWRGPAMDGIQSQPTVLGDRVIVNSAGFQAVDPHIRAFDTATGDERWRYDTGHFSDSTPAVDDGSVYVSSEGGFHAVDLASGEESFVKPDLTARRSTPAAADGTVFAVSEGRSGRADEVIALEASTGTEHWRVALASEHTPVVTDSAVYAGVDGGVAELDRTDGSVRTTTSATRAEPVGLVGDVLYAERGGSLFALDTTNELEALWALTTEEVQVSDTVGRAIYHVTPVDDAVYVSARDAFYGIGPAG